MANVLIFQRSGETEQDSVMYPNRYSWDNPPYPLPILILGHGASGSENASMVLRDMWALADRGVLVIAGDFGGEKNFGNDASIAQVEELVTYVRSIGAGSTDPVVTFGISMGNLTTLNWALQHPTDWKAHVSMVGLWDIQELYDRLDNYDADIDAAYGGTYDDAVHGPTHSPDHYVHTLPSAHLLSYYGTNDTTVPPSVEEGVVANWNGNVVRIPDYKGYDTHSGVIFGSGFDVESVLALVRL